MDHTPGQRQFVSLAHHRIYYMGKSGMTEDAYGAMIARRQELSARYAARHRRAIADLCQASGIVIASHDDATAAMWPRASSTASRVAEFPTTVEAAEAARAGGLRILMGAPNVVRGGSHSGNVSARALMDAGLLDILSSDYVPFSLLHAVFMVAAEEPAILPAAVATITRTRRGRPVSTTAARSRSAVAAISCRVDAATRCLGSARSGGKACACHDRLLRRRGRPLGRRQGQPDRRRPRSGSRATRVSCSSGAW